MSEALFKYQDKTSDTNRYKGDFMTGRFFQVIVNTMKRILEQQSEL